MGNVSIMPAALADSIPLPDGERVARELAEARQGFGRKIVVLDDDPTGVQIGTANFVDPQVTVKAIDYIEDYLKRHQITSVRELIGGMEV